MRKIYLHGACKVKRERRTTGVSFLPLDWIYCSIRIMTVLWTDDSIVFTQYIADSIAQRLALNPGFPFQILSCKRDKIRNGKLSVERDAKGNSKEFEVSNSFLFWA